MNSKIIDGNSAKSDQAFVLYLKTHLPFSSVGKRIMNFTPLPGSPSSVMVQP